MIIDNVLKMWFIGIRECPFTEAKIYVLQMLGTNERVCCPEFRSGHF